MKWIVSGQMQKTGEASKMTVEADSMREAFEDAKQRGLNPIDATKVSETKSPRPLTSNASTPQAVPQPVVRARASKVTPAAHPLERMIAYLFIVSGAGSMLYGVISRMQAAMTETVGSDYETNLSGVARAAALALRGEYLIVTGGACVAIGVGLLLLRQIAINTARVE